YAATYLLAVDWHLNPASHMVVVGEAHDPLAQAMHRQALASFVPRRVVQLVGPSQVQARPLPPALREMLRVAKETRGYLCTGTSCSQPASDLVQWQSTLESARPGVHA
ncbi:MAG TPA: hypothetical protein VFD73_17535, partial [Gemmatimonadales bacterium]|nr:hypothetical protein [Gemmatimonadales bacterium]